MSVFTREYTINLIEKTLKNFEVYRQKAASFEFIEKSDYAHLFESNSDSESVSTKRTLELNDSNHTTIKSEKKSLQVASSKRFVQSKRKSDSIEQPDDREDLTAKKLKSEKMSPKLVNTERQINRKPDEFEKSNFTTGRDNFTVEQEPSEIPKCEYYSIFNFQKERNSCEPLHETSLIKTEQETNGISFEAKTVGISAKTTVIKPRQRNPYQLEIKFAMGLTRQIFSKIDLEHGHYPDIVNKCQSKLRIPLDPIKVAQVKETFFERFKIEESKRDQIWYSIRAQINQKITHQFSVKATHIKNEDQELNQV